MSNTDKALTHSADRAFEVALEDQLDIVGLKRELRLVAEELGYLKTFNTRLLHVLKLQLQMDDQTLDGLMAKAATIQTELVKEPGTQVAPLCAFCDRPLQQERDHCIYCGKRCS